MEEPGSQTALDLLYIKLLRRSLLPVGGWPIQNPNDKNYQINFRIVNIIIQILVVIGQIIYLHDAFGEVEFLLVGDVFITTFLTTLSVVRLSLPQFKTYCNIFRTFLMEFHLIYFKHRRETSETVFATMEKISRYFTFFMSCLAVFGLVLFNLSPMYMNIKNGVFTSNRHNMVNLSLEFTVKYKYPGFDPKDYFMTTTIINVYLSFVCTLSIVAIDLLVILITFQIIGHLELLAMNMRSMPKPKMTKEINNKGYLYDTEIFDEEENLEIKQLLRELVDHHNLIIRKYVRFFWSIFWSYLLVSSSLLLFVTTRVFPKVKGKVRYITAQDPDVIVQFGPLTAVIFMQLIQLSVTFEILGHKSNVLIDCVYGLPWQSMNRENQRIVSIILLRVQSPVRVTAFGLADVGVKTMANILKTTFSYYTFLRTL